jgi:release factor glutamine methyltransferase
MTIFEILSQATHILQTASISDAKRHAEWLLAFVLDQNLSYLIARGREELPAEVTARYFTMVAERSQGKPIQYLLGSQEFRGMKFEVTSAVLIPRPETEYVVEEALRCLSSEHPLVVDVGTGSGCIAISIAKALPHAKVMAVDLSAAALEVARRNAQSLEAEAVRFLQGDLLAPLEEMGIVGQLDCVVSNPPYVAEEDLATLQREVRNWEPRMALVAGPGGVSVFKRLIPQAAKLLKPGGWFVAEIGYNMQEAVCSLFDGRWQVDHVRADFNGIPRVVVAQRLPRG